MLSKMGLTNQAVEAFFIRRDVEVHEEPKTAA